MNQNRLLQQQQQQQQQQYQQQQNNQSNQEYEYQQQQQYNQVQDDQQKMRLQESSQNQQQQNHGFSPQDVAYYIENLKRNYLERLESFQMNIKEVIEKMDGDEVLDSLKNDNELEQFRIERFKEILKQSFSYEQELYIDKMIEANAMLKLDLKKAEEDKYSEIESAKMEIQNISKKVLEFESTFQQEAAQKAFIQNEYDKLVTQKNLEKTNYDELMKIKESSISKSDHMYKQELQNSRKEIESLLKEKSSLQIQNEQMKDQLDSLSKNLQIYSQKQQARGETDRIIEQKSEEMKNTILRLQAQVADLQSANEHHIEQLQMKEQDVLAIKTSLAETQKENDYLSENTEKLKVQITKFESLIGEKTNELSKKLEKVRNKKKALKEKMNQSKQISDNQSRDVSQYKKALQDQGDQYERTIQAMKSDMLTIKNEWERRCNEVETQAQIQINQSKSKNELQVSKIKQEYQQLLDKKMHELEESNNQLNFSKGFTSQVQVKMQQIEKDYILKEAHDKILEEEVSKIQARHQEAINSMTERHQNNIQAKIKEISERKAREYETLSQGLQTNYLDLQAKLQDQIKLNTQYKEKILEVENSFYKTKDENNQQSLYIKQLTDTNEDYVRVQKKLQNDIENLKIEIEEINNSKREVEEGLQEQLELNSQLNANLEKIQNNLEDYHQKELQWQNETDELQNSLQESYTNQESLQNQLEQIKQKLDVEKQSALRNIQFQENLKLEKEREEHEETKQKMLQLEKRIKNSQREIEKQKEEFEEKYQQTQDKLLKTNGQKEKIETEKRELLNQNNELQQKFELFATKLNRDKQRICKRLGLQLKSLKDDLQDLQQDSQSDASRMFELSKQTLNNFVDYFNDTKARDTNQIENQFRYSQEQMLNEFNEKMEQIEENYRNERNKAGVEVEELIEQLKQENDQLNDKISSLTSTLEMQEREKKKLDQSIANLEKHNEKLEGIIKKNSEDMEEHNKFFAAEIKRIKEESNNLVSMAVESAVTSSKQDVENLQKKLQSYQAAKEKSKVDLEAIPDLKREIQQREENLEDLQRHYENELKIKDEDLEKKDKLIEKLRVELQEMQIIYERMQEENNQAFEVLESKLENYKQAISSEAEKYQVVKEQSSQEIQNLNDELIMLRQQLTLKGQNIDNLAKYQEIQTYSKRSQLPQQLLIQNSTINSQMQSQQYVGQSSHPLPPQHPSHLSTGSSVFSTQRNTQQQQQQQQHPTSYSVNRTLKQNNSASNLIQQSSDASPNAYHRQYQQGNSSASKLLSVTQNNVFEKPVKLEGNIQPGQTNISSQQPHSKLVSEKPYAKKHSLDRSFDAQKLDTLSELSRQHKIASQAKIASQNQYPPQAPQYFAKGSTHSPVADKNTPQLDNSNNISNNNISQSRNLKTNASSDSSLLFEIKHLLAQSYELVSKNTNIANGAAGEAKSLVKQNSRGSLGGNHSSSVTVTQNDSTNAPSYGHIKSVGGNYNNIPSSSTARLQKYGSNQAENNSNKQNMTEENYDIQQGNYNNNNTKKSLTSRYSTKNSDFSFKNSNNNN